VAPRDGRERSTMEGAGQRSRGVAIVARMHLSIARTGRKQYERSVTMKRIAEASPRLKARIAGALYLLSGLTAAFTELLVRGRLNPRRGPHRGRGHGRCDAAPL
jgi:hypothetical protein